MREVKVELGGRSYQIQIGSELLDSIGRQCKKLSLGRRCMVITDSNVGPLYGEKVGASLSAAGFESVQVTVRAGEQTKSWRTAAYCHDQLAAHRMERGSFIVALGGGVIGDLAGFVAATYLRGVAFVQVPTTLLAQVDSSVGGKTGINLTSGKNLVGAFYQPRHVFCDLSTLDSLPDRELRSGLSEVVKYGIIYDDVFFRRLEKLMPALVGRQSKALGEIVARCCAIKADVVGQDETETGLRAILNFGHTIGHALEAVTHYKKYLHGEAISIGQVAAARLSCLQAGLTSAEARSMETLLEKAGLPVHLTLKKQQVESLIQAMSLDKKVSDGVVKFVLASRLGQVQWGCKVPMEQVREVLYQLV
jgi:3-dehydroquinate synthase